MPRTIAFTLAAVLGLAVSPAALSRAAFAENAALFSDRFAENPLESGWTFVGASPEEGEWLHDANSNAHCIGAKHGMWDSPKFAVVPLQYYKVAFHAKGAAAPYGHLWSIRFFDAAGNHIQADTSGIVEPSATWKLNEIYVRAKFQAAHAILRFQPSNDKLLWIGNVMVSAASGEQVLAWADARYEALPQLQYSPPRNRFKHIPETIEKLRTGGKLRVVMLGDAIVDDIGNSPWDLLVGREYPQAKIEVITSVLESGGTQIFREANRMKDLAVNLAPDLLIVGGSSNRSIDDHKECIRQMNAAGCYPEIMLMTGALTPRFDGQRPWSLAIDLNGPGWRDQLLKLAIVSKYEFVDVQGPFSQYESYADKPAEYWRRDESHANDNARAIFARILAAWFAPKGLLAEGR